MPPECALLSKVGARQARLGVRKGVNQQEASPVIAVLDEAVSTVLTAKQKGVLN